MGLERTGNGYLVDPTIWTEEIMHEMAKEDDMEPTESMVGQIMSKRILRREFIGTAHPNFCKIRCIDKKILFKEWLTGPMKPITKYGGMPQPTGCV